jgi:hypothetical protein
MKMPEEKVLNLDSTTQKKLVALILFEPQRLGVGMSELRPEYFDHPALTALVVIVFRHNLKYQCHPSLEEVEAEFNELFKKDPRLPEEEYRAVFEAVLGAAEQEQYDWVADKALEFARRQGANRIIEQLSERIKRGRDIDLKAAADEMAAVAAIGEGRPTDEWVIDTVCAADVAEERLEWLWHNTFPKASLSVVMGEPGVGKSWFTSMVAARVSTGQPFPSHSHVRPEAGSVIFLQAEDDLKTMLRRRLRLEGADAQRIHFIRGLVRSSDGTRRSLDLTSDVERLRRKMHELGDVRLIIVDPLSAYVGLASRMDSHKERDVRIALSPLESLIETERVAVLGIMHLNKNQMADAIFRISGSAAWAQVPRMIWAIARHHDDRDVRSFLNAKRNALADADVVEGEFCFRIDSTAHCLTVVEDAQPGDVKEALAAPSSDDAKDRRSKTKQAVDVLEALRADHLSFVPADDVMKEFPNISKSIWWRAREQAGVRSRKSPDDGRWVWLL